MSDQEINRFISPAEEQERKNAIISNMEATTTSNAEDSQQKQEDESSKEVATTTPAPPAAAPQRRKINANILGSIVTQTVVSNLPAGQKPMPEWKRKALEREAIARGEVIPERKEGELGEQQQEQNADGTTTTTATSNAGLYRPPHQRLPPAPLVSQQAQERSAFPGDFWFHKEIENLIGKHRRKVHIRENEDDAFFDRGGKAGRGVIASYIVDAFPLVRNARPRRVREAMKAGEIFPENATTELIDESNRKIMPGDEDYEEDDDEVKEVKIGGGIDEDY